MSENDDEHERCPDCEEDVRERGEDERDGALLHPEEGGELLVVDGRPERDPGRGNEPSRVGISEEERRDGACEREEHREADRGSAHREPERRAQDGAPASVVGHIEVEAEEGARHSSPQQQAHDRGECDERLDPAVVVGGEVSRING